MAVLLLGFYGGLGFAGLQIAGDCPLGATASVCSLLPQLQSLANQVLMGSVVAFICFFVFAAATPEEKQ